MASGSQSISCPVRKPRANDRLRRLRGAARRFASRLDLGQRQPCMVEKGPAGGGQFDAVRAAAQQLDADLVFEIADLAAQRRLRRVQPFLGRERQAALLGDRDEIAKVPQLHSGFHICKVCPQLTKSFSQAPGDPIASNEAP